MWYSVFKRAEIKLLILSMILVVYYGCERNQRDKGIRFYVREFKQNEQTFDSLSNYLLVNYGKDSSYKNQIRLIFINPNKQKKTLKIEKVDSNILRWLNMVNVQSLNIEREDNACLNGYNFDKIYFLIQDEEYYPQIYYIFSTCAFDSINKQTQTIKRRTISPHWDILIDNSL